jgi:hypothetical protein
MEQAWRGRPASFEEFGTLVASVLGVAPDRLRPTDCLVRDVDVDEVSLSQLVLAIQDVNPYFALPDQVEVHDVSLADLYHFCCVMDVGHHEPTTSEEQR